MAVLRIEKKSKLNQGGRKGEIKKVEDIKTSFHDLSPQKYVLSTYFLDAAQRTKPEPVSTLPISWRCHTNAKHHLLLPPSYLRNKAS
jgi:hypothetical protein